MKQLLVLIGLATMLLSVSAADNSKVQSELTKRYAEWDKALCSADMAMLDQIYSDDVKLTSPEGKLDTKESWLARVKSGEYKCSNPATSELHVQVYGNTAVAIGVWKATEFDKGQKAEAHYRFTDTWVNRRGTWRLVASQVTAVMPSK